jgi:glutaredoxin 3
MLKCASHGLAAGSDGLCELCRRERGTPTASPTSFLGIVGVLLAIVAAAGIMRTKLTRHDDEALPELPATQAMSVAPSSSVAGPASAASAPRSEWHAPQPGRAPLLDRRKPLPASATRPAAAATPALAPTLTPMPTPIVAGPTRIERAPGAQSVEITMYTTSWCPRCREAKAWMAANGVAYSERDIDASETNRAECRKFNPQTSIPTTVVDGTVLVGFEDRYFRDAIDAAERRRRARGR